MRHTTTLLAAFAILISAPMAMASGPGRGAKVRLPSTAKTLRLTRNPLKRLQQRYVGKTVVHKATGKDGTQVERKVFYRYDKSAKALRPRAVSYKAVQKDGTKIEGTRFIVAKDKRATEKAVDRMTSTTPRRGKESLVGVLKGYLSAMRKTDITGTTITQKDGTVVKHTRFRTRDSESRHLEIKDPSGVKSVDRYVHSKKGTWAERKAFRKDLHDLRLRIKARNAELAAKRKK